MKLIRKTLLGLFAAVFGVVGLFASFAFADTEFSVSPMNQRIVLTQGEDYSGTFEIINPEYNTGTFYYELSVEPFFVDENYQPVYRNNGDYNQIVDWIELENKKGSVEPNEIARVNFTVHTPKNAPAGGQYAVIRVANDYEMTPNDSESGINVQSVPTIVHILYAEVAGETERGGEIINTSVPSFLFSGDISGTATIKNTGNVHADASYVLQIFPLFSDEEVFTNEENPKLSNILPGVARTTTVDWEETPSIGIFHVIYNVEFEGVNQKVDKMVIVCPLWLLFIIAVIIFLIIFKILSGKKERK